MTNILVSIIINTYMQKYIVQIKSYVIIHIYYNVAHKNVVIHFINSGIENFDEQVLYFENLPVQVIKQIFCLLDVTMRQLYQFRLHNSVIFCRPHSCPDNRKTVDNTEELFVTMLRSTYVGVAKMSIAKYIFAIDEKSVDISSKPVRTCYTYHVTVYISTYWTPLQYSQRHTRNFSFHGEGHVYCSFYRVERSEVGLWLC